MYIPLPGRHHGVNIFQPKAFAAGLSLPSLSIFWAASRRSEAAILTSPGFILFKVTLRQVAFGLPARSFSVSCSF